MTDRPDFKAMRERCDAATQGPWTFTREDRMGCAYIMGFLTDGNGKAWTETRVVFGDCDTHDAQFIAHARTDLPACLDRIAELEGLLRTCRRMMDPASVSEYRRLAVQVGAAIDEAIGITQASGDPKQ